MSPQHEIQGSTQALYIINQAPYASSVAVETMEMAMVSASFELPTAILFIHDGVFQLLKNQVGGLKNTSKMFKAAADYDIEPLYVGELSLLARGILPEDLIVPAIVVSNDDITRLVAQSQQVVKL